LRRTFEAVEEEAAGLVFVRATVARDAIRPCLLGDLRRVWTLLRTVCGWESPTLGEEKVGERGLFSVLYILAALQEVDRVMRAILVGDGPSLLCLSKACPW
jgi:hypothetical protein